VNYREKVILTVTEVTLVVKSLKAGKVIHYDDNLDKRISLVDWCVSRGLCELEKDRRVGKLG